MYLQDYNLDYPETVEEKAKESKASDSQSINETPEEPITLREEEPQQLQQPIRAAADSDQPIRSWESQERAVSGRGQAKSGQPQTTKNDNFIPSKIILNKHALIPKYHSN